MSESLNRDIVIKKLKSEECISMYKDANINGVILFGSFAENSFYEDSDIDIAILSEKKLDLMSIMELEERLEIIFDKEIDLINLDNEELDIRFKVNVYDTGILVYNDEKNLYDKDYEKVNKKYKYNETFRFFRERDVLNE
ncbi:MAG: type VII toxin-antitoxin system MntA family adenylyltransferase antitoxin [Clostridium sp.]|uniref:type VII toxin-antitoxin system MntA family adenylyltransferase antitoxin n=1 Tax=Clostridium sp. TaxID=1506 RepID=UPI003F38E914